MKSRSLLLLLVLATLVTGWLGSRAVDEGATWGWDESMHAGLPAMRISQHLKHLELTGAAEVAVECQQYPFMVPVVWGALDAAFSEVGEAEVFGRRVGRWGLALLALGVALLGRELVRAMYERREDDVEEWLAAGLGFALVLASPLAVDYSATWFLEVPFACLAVWTVWAWLRRVARRAEPGAWRRDLLCGALVMAAFFTKFNYGLLLGFGLALALAWEALGLAVPKLRATWPAPLAWGAFARSVLWLALVPALGFAWWFVLPLPGGSELAASHREAFMAFLSGNQHLNRTPDAQRLLDWGVHAVTTPRLLLLLVAGIGGLVWIGRRRAPVIAVWLIWLACLLPIVLHNFHLDRFLVLPLVLALPLGIVGLLWLARLGARGNAAQGSLALVPLLVLGASVFPRWDGALWFDATVGFHDDPDVRAYQERILANFQNNDFDRKLTTAGLDVVAAGKLLDAVADEVLVEGAPARSFGWLGISSELSPAALVAGVYARADARGLARPDLGAAAATRPDGNPRMVLSFQDIDPGWNDEQLFAWASSFDVVFTTVPPDLRGRGGREFIRGYQSRLIGSGRVETREVAAVQVPQPFGPPKFVQLFALVPQR